MKVTERLALRKRIFELLSEDLTNVVIAERLGMHPNSISKYRKIYNEKNLRKKGG